MALQDGDEFLLLACDGIWDVLTNQEVHDSTMSLSTYILLFLRDLRKLGHTRLLSTGLAAAAIRSCNVDFALQPGVTLRV